MAQTTAAETPQTSLKVPRGKVPGEGAGFYEKANHVWQVTGGALIAPIALTILITGRFMEWDIPTYTWLLWLQVPVLMLHEFEEYVLPGGFKSFFNHDTVFASEVPGDNTPLNEGYVFAVNIISVWGWGILGALLAGVAPWVGFSLVIFNILINDVQHSVLFQIRHQGYNPGLITTMVLLLPYGTFMFIYVIANGVLSPLDWVLAVVLSLAVMGTYGGITRSHMKKTTTALA